MRYYRFEESSGKPFLVVEKGGATFDLTGTCGGTVSEFEELLRASRLVGTSLDELAAELLERKNAVPCSFEELAERGWRLARPVLPKEVWAAGVTYRISCNERQKESALPEHYARVYDAERPEIFFKATAERCVGPLEPIGIRADSVWNVPEPELACILYHGEIVAYTIGNDVSSRSIEGENPLYLPQAKVYDRCCAIGPCLAGPAGVPDPRRLEIECEILRRGKTIFEGKTSTSQMVRSCEELAQFLVRHNHVPDCTVLLTGTAVVPPEEITLCPGDRVRITIEKIGTLENPVIQV